MHNIFLKGIRLYVSSRSSFHTSNVICNKQAGKILKKMLTGAGNHKKKFYYNETPSMPNPYTFSKGSAETKISGNSRRAKVLNKIFMRYITDLMATGSCATDILGHGIEINRVKISPNYKILNVYWIAKSTDVEKIDNILKKSAGYLRHELSQLRVIGEIPLIQFVKDKNYWSLAEVDARLSKADFGDDYEQLDTRNKLKNELELLTSIETNVKEQINILDNLSIDENEDIPLPPMPQNVLGLNHKEILDRIKTSLKKSKFSKDDEKWTSFKVQQSVNANPVNFGSPKSQREAFKQFLQQRQVLKTKARSHNKYLSDTDYVREELSGKYEEEFNDIQFFKEDEDYLEEKGEE